MLDKAQVPIQLNENQLNSEIFETLKILGLFYSFGSFERIWIEKDGNRTELRNTLEFFSPALGEAITPSHEEKIIRPLNGATFFVIEKKTFMVSFKNTDNLSIFLNSTGIDFGDFFSTENRFWYKSNIIWPAGDAYTFAIDSKIKCPSWLFIGTEKELKNEWKGHSVSGGDAWEALENSALKLHRSSMPELFPCNIIRFRQELIYIERNRLNDLDAEEYVDLKFPNTGMGYSVVNSNKTYLKYVLKNTDEVVIGHGEIEVNRDLMINGLKLRPVTDVENKKIYLVDIELWMGNILMDWSFGGYIRKIQIKVNIQK